LLDVTRVSQNKIRLRLTRLDLNDVVQRAIDDHRLLLEERDITVNPSLSAEPLSIDGDEARLAQVVGNLLSNAAKFTPRGGSVTIRTVKQTASTRRPGPVAWPDWYFPYSRMPAMAPIPASARNVNPVTSSQS